MYSPDVPTNAMLEPRFTVVSVAGFDPTGGAGLIADIKTIHALGGYGLGVMTANTIQNTRGAVSVAPVEPAFFAKQLNDLFSDIRVDAVKIGLLPSMEIVDALVHVVQHLDCPVVLDTPFRASSGLNMADDGVVERVMTHLLPRVSLVTPNWAEAGILANKPVTDDNVVTVCQQLAVKFNTAVLLKGGHADQVELKEVYCATNSHEPHVFKHHRINSNNTHGTGCTLSAAIAALLADPSLVVANFPTDIIAMAIEYLQKALVGSQDWQLNRGDNAADAKTGLHHFC